MQLERHSSTLKRHSTPQAILRLDTPTAGATPAHSRKAEVSTIRIVNDTSYTEPHTELHRQEARLPQNPIYRSTRHTQSLTESPTQNLTESTTQSITESTTQNLTESTTQDPLHRAIQSRAPSNNIVDRHWNESHCPALA